MRGIVSAVVSVVAAMAGSSLQASDPRVLPATGQARIWDKAVRDQVSAFVEMGTRDDGRLIAALDTIAVDPALDPAVRDAMVYGYVASLRRRAAGEPSGAVLDWLAAYRPLAFRHHEESASAIVPLFDVAAATQGLRHELRFRQGFDAMLDDPVAAYAASFGVDVQQDAAWLHGAAAAVQALPPRALAEMTAVVSAAPKRNDDVDPLAVAAISAGGDVDGVIAVLAGASATRAADMLRSMRNAFSPTDAYRVIVSAVGHPDAGVRSLAMAQASALVKGDPSLAPSWHRRLRELLGDPEAGATAALQLARLPISALDGLHAGSGDDALLNQRLELIERLRSLSADDGADAEQTP